MSLFSPDLITFPKVTQNLYSCVGVVWSSLQVLYSEAVGGPS